MNKKIKNTHILKTTDKESYYVHTSIGGGDSLIARYFGISIESYRGKLVELGGIKPLELPFDRCGDIRFYKMKDVLKAQEFVESMFMALFMAG